MTHVDLEVQEIKGDEAEELQNEVRIENPHDYFTTIPNIVDDMGLTPYTYRLYGHLRRVAGEKGACWQSTRTLAEKCRMSVGQVSQSKKDLLEIGLIRITEKDHPNFGKYHLITIIDIWAKNHAYYADGVHAVNTPPSPDEHPYSLGERKKNSVTNNPVINNKRAGPELVAQAIINGAKLQDQNIWPVDIQEYGQIWNRLMGRRCTKAEFSLCIKEFRELRERQVSTETFENAYHGAVFFDGMTVTHPLACAYVAEEIRLGRRDCTGVRLGPKNKAKKLPAKTAVSAEA